MHIPQINRQMSPEMVQALIDSRNGQDFPQPGN
jgi:hypothetical protein